MNIGVTNRCSRRCEFCFQKEWFLESPERPLMEMPIEMFQRIIRRFNVKEFGLFGGEPLLYSHLHELVDFCKENDVSFHILSNISVEHDIVQKLLRKGRKNINGWLINSDYTDSQRDLFLQNLVTIIDDNLGKDSNFTLGTTLVPKQGCADASIERLGYIIKRVPMNSIKNIRISTTTPTHNKVFRVFDYSGEIDRFVVTLRKIHPNLRFHFDCQPCACEVSGAVTDKYIDFLKREPKVCDSPVVDIMPDGKVYWCSSATFLYLNNVFSYSDYDSLEHALQLKWREWWGKRKFPAQCAICPSLKGGVCYGLCSGKYNAIQKLSDGEE